MRVTPWHIALGIYTTLIVVGYTLIIYLCPQILMQLAISTTIINVGTTFALYLVYQNKSPKLHSGWLHHIPELYWPLIVIAVIQIFLTGALLKGWYLQAPWSPSMPDPSIFQFIGLVFGLSSLTLPSVWEAWMVRGTFAMLMLFLIRRPFFQLLNLAGTLLGTLNWNPNYAQVKLQHISYRAAYWAGWALLIYRRENKTRALINFLGISANPNAAIFLLYKLSFHNKNPMVASEIVLALEKLSYHCPLRDSQLAAIILEHPQTLYPKLFALLPGLRSRFLSQSQQQQHLIAMRALAIVAPKDNEEILQRVLQLWQKYTSKDNGFCWQRQAILWLWSKIASDLTLFEQALNDRQPTIRREAAIVLGDIARNTTPKAATMLISAFSRENDPQIQQVIADQLEQTIPHWQPHRNDRQYWQNHLIKLGN